MQSDLVVGADGIDSAVRAAVADEVRPRSSGQFAARGVARTGEVTPTVTSESWGRGLRFGLVPLRNGLTYWFAATTTRVAVENPHATFALWHSPIAEVLGAPQVGSTPVLLLQDLPPLRTWHDRRSTVLVGDAAHAMTPNLGQGSAQALEDVAVLLSELASAPVPDALVAYEHRRKRRAERVVARSRMAGRWDTSLGDALRLQRYDNAVALYLPGGAVLPFTRDSVSGAWKAPSGLDAKLTLTGSGAAGRVLFRGNGLTYGFSDGSPASTGLLTSIKTKNGNTITVVHQGGTGAVGRVIDTQGRDFSYGYDTSGRLTSITNAAGSRSLSYGYDTSGRLSSYTDVNGATTNYGYDSNDRLSSITSPEARSTEIGYDSQSRVATISRHGTACTAVNVTATTSYAYATPDSGAPTTTDLFARVVGMTTVTNAESKATKYYTDTQRRVGRVTDLPRGSWTTSICLSYAATCCSVHCSRTSCGVL